MNDISMDKLVRTFYCQKFEALGISIFTILMLLSTIKTPDGIDMSMLFSRNSIPYLMVFLISISSWHLNVHAESSCAFKTAHALFYAAEAAIQDCIMTICVGVLVVFALFHIVATGWFVIGCVGLLLLLIWKVRETYLILKLVGLMNMMNIAPDYASAAEETWVNLFCGFIR